VVWHSFGEVDVFLPYTDGRCHADPDMEENPMRMPKCHAMADIAPHEDKYMNIGPAVPRLTPIDFDRASEGGTRPGPTTRTR
jgi:hypothetical protein